MTYTASDGVYNARKWGARLNGVDDDSGAILDAWNAMPVNGGTLLIPGQAGLGSGLRLEGKANARIEARGENGGFKGLAQSAVTAQTFGNSLVHLRGNTRLHCDGVRIDAGSFAHNGIVSDQNLRSTFDDMEVLNAGHSAGFVAIGGRGNRYRNNKVHDTLPDTRGFWLGNLAATEIEYDAVVTENEAWNCGHSGIVVSPAGAIVYGNHAHDNAVAGIKITLRRVSGVQGAAIYGNITYRNAQGVQITSVDDDGNYGMVATLQGNQSWGNTEHGFLVDKGRDLAILGNFAYDNLGSGMYVIGGRNISLAANHCFDTREGTARTQQKGLFVVNDNGEDSYGILIGLNYCYNNVDRNLNVENQGARQVNDWLIAANMAQGGQHGIFVADTVTGAVNRGAILGNYSVGNTSNFRNDPPDTVIDANRLS